MRRIETISSTFVQVFLKADRERKNLAKMKALEFAISKSGIDDPIVLETLRMLKNSDHKSYAPVGDISKIRDRYDNEYFRLYEIGDEPAARKSALKFFGKARAASALVFAMQGDSDDNILECIYEAVMTVNDSGDILAELASDLA